MCVCLNHLNYEAFSSFASLKALWDTFALQTVLNYPSNLKCTGKCTYECTGILHWILNGHPDKKIKFPLRDTRQWRRKI